MGALSEFGSLKKMIDRGEWLTMTPVWVQRPFTREYGQRNIYGSVNGTRKGIGGRYPVQNSGVDLQLQVMERLG